MTIEQIFIYIAVLIVFGVNSFNELDRRTNAGTANYALATLTSLFWPLSLFYSIWSMMVPSPR